MRNPRVENKLDLKRLVRLFPHRVSFSAHFQRKKALSQIDKAVGNSANIRRKAS
jgi:hypothetical protein